LRVLFISLAQINSLEDRGIYHDLLRQFDKKGHELVIVSPLERRLNKSNKYFKIGRIQILQVWILNIQKCNIIEKVFSTLTISYFFKRAIKKNIINQNFDLILYTTPPITLTNLIVWLKIKTKAKTYLLLKDIFPQNAVDMGLVKYKSIFYFLLKAKENNLYKVSDKIGCMSPANQKYILNEYPSLEDKLEINPNSIELRSGNHLNSSREEIFRPLNIPSESKIFLYGGNLGLPQGVMFLTEIISCCKILYPEVFFLIIGDGTDYLKLQKWFILNNPSNAKLIQMLPKIIFDKISSHCDVGLILLRSNFTIPNFPSRLLTYLENSIPVLSFTDSVSDIGPISEKFEFGKWAYYGDLTQALIQVEYFIQNEERRKKMGVNGLNYLISECNVENSYRKIEEFVNN
jgi:glycosyltransferase involved in cell wall biosynthesis